MDFNPNDFLEATVGIELERVRNEKASVWIKKFEQGLLTVEELRDRLTEIVEEF